MAEETTKIVRMQQRRGLKQDLPKPLRPGEIGFATDSRQLYIGADTSDETAQTFNKTCVFEKTASAQSLTTSFADTQIIKFTVPHRWYNKGDFDGATTTASWIPTSNTSASSPGDSPFSGTVFRSSDNVYTDITSNTKFSASSVSVVKNGTVLEYSDTPTISSGKDYYFNQSGTGASNAHTLTFRTPPSGSEEIGIVYYSNSDVIAVIDGETSVQGFYAYANLIDPDTSSVINNRYIADTNIRVTPDTGVGHIGLQYKHIQVATDVRDTPLATSITPGELGTLYLSRNDQIDSNVTMTANATAVVLTPVSGDLYNVSTEYNHTYVESVSSGWLGSKVLEVIDVTGNTIIALLPNNASSLTRSVTSIADESSNLSITIQSSEGIETGDTLYFIDSGNVTNLDNVESGVVIDVDPTQVTLTGLSGANVSANTSNLMFITYKAGSNSNVLVSSTNHGLPTGTTTVVMGEDGNANTIFGASSTAYISNANTFVVDTLSTAVTSNINLLTFTPVVANATVSATPVLSIDLSSANDANDATVEVNEGGYWCKLNFIANSANKLYLTHSEAATKNTLWADTNFGFKIHEDSNRTVSQLGLPTGNFDRTNATVKAKLENWMQAQLSNTSVNVFTEIFSNDEFNSTGYFSEWILDIDTATSEVYFDSRTEARDFSTIINNLYYESVNPDVKGLLNIKTNIEFLTYEALAAGSASTTYEAPETVIINSGTDVVSELSANAATGAVNTVFIEYSIKDSYTNNSFSYARVGTLKYIGDSASGQVALIDTYSDVGNSVTGNITFTASIGSGDAVTVTANNSISPSNDMVMKFVRRRWSNTR